MTLRGHGFTGDQIIAAARDARSLGFSPRDRQAMIDHATIRRYSIDADGMVAGLQDFRGRLQGDQEYQDLARRLAAATTEAERQALREQIRQRERILEGESALGRNLANPLEDERAKRAAEGRRNGLIEQRRRQLGIHELMGDEAALNTSVEQLREHQLGASRTAIGTSEQNTGNLLATVGRGTATPDANTGSLLTAVAAAPDANAGREGTAPLRQELRPSQNTTVRLRLS